jgi:diacylglycerol kinase family enzyme
MKSILLFYNSSSGDGEHSGEKLEQQIKATGFSCKLLSDKKGIGGIKGADIFAVAGGDGTIRKFILLLLEQPLKYLRPIGLLPLGTANNISKTLKIKSSDDTGKQITQWKKDHRKPFDIGIVISSEREYFFTESMGYGIFPKLIKEMRKVSKATIQTPEEEFDIAFGLLYTIAENYRARTCRIELDGKKYPGKYIMVEIMNIQYLGSNMCIAPTAEPGDGWMDIVLVPEDGRSQLLSYIEKLKTNTTVPFPFKTIRALEAKIYWGGRVARFDDEVIRLDKPQLLKIRLLNQLLHFLS